MWCHQREMERNCCRVTMYKPDFVSNSQSCLWTCSSRDSTDLGPFVFAIYRRYISETSHGLPNIKTINHQDIGTIFAISHRDIVVARLRCDDILQSKMIYRCSKVHCDDMSYWTALHQFIVMKRLCTMNPCLCTCNGHSRVIVVEHRPKFCFREALHASP